MKRKGLKKIVTLMSALCMFGTVLTGCGGSSSTSGNGSVNEAAFTDDGKVNTSNEVELSMYVISDRPAGQDIVDENLNKLLKEKLNCTLKVNYIGWAEYANKYPLLFSSGEQFDMVYSATWLNFPSLARKGAFMNLDELWEKCAPNNFAKQSKTAKDQAKIGEHYYCVPSLLSTYDTFGPIYRTDIMEGTDWNGKMDTFEDIEAYCEIVKETHPEMEPLGQYAAAPEWYFMYLKSKDLNALKGIRFLWYDPMSEHPEIFTPYEYDGTEEFLDMMKRWNEKGFFSKSALSDTDSTKFENGKSAIKLHNMDTYASLAAQNPDWGIQYSNLVSDVYHLPYTQDCMAISNTSQNPERALALWDLLTSDQEVYNAFTYGIEGVTYEVNDKNQYKITDTDLYATTAMWAVRTDEFNLEQEGTPDDIKVMRETYESEIQPGVGNERYAGFMFDTTAIETELAACNNVQQQYWWPLELGYTDAATALEEYKSKMEAAGIEKIREEAQRQLDEYINGLD